jgi:hypothetical protein
LAPREFAVLEFLIREAGRPISRATITEEIWNIPFDPATNVVDVYVKYVRDKVDRSGEMKLIRTVQGGKNDTNAAVAAWEKLLTLNPDFPQKEMVEHMIAEAEG